MPAGPLLVTPEAVVLDLPTAGLPTRMLARGLDLALQAALLVATLLALGVASGAGAPDTALVIVAFFAMFLLVVGYPVASESLLRGRTPGKIAVGLRVVTVEGAPVRFRHALIRTAGDMVDLLGCGVLPGVVGVTSIVLSPRGQRLGDVAAGTVVVRERSGLRPPAPVSFGVPPGLEAYAATVDVSALDHAGYRTVRSFLVRAGSLTPAARDRLAVQLGTALADRLRHRPPPWVTPELFLHTVAARYQQRGTAAPGSTGRWGVEPPRPPAAPPSPPTPPPASPSGFVVPG